MNKKSASKYNNASSKVEKPKNSEQSRVKEDIEFLLKELKLNKHQSSDANDYYDLEYDSKMKKSEESDKLQMMALNLKDLLGRLLEKRKIAKRNMIVDKMTREEIHAEKIDTQKELLTFEEKHGRPVSVPVC